MYYPHGNVFLSDIQETVSEVKNESARGGYKDTITDYVSYLTRTIIMT
jgi:hypothetical protein